MEEYDVENYQDIKEFIQFIDIDINKNIQTNNYDKYFELY